MRTSSTTVKMSSTISQPTATWPCERVEHLVVAEPADEHDGARHRRRHAQHQAELERQPERIATTTPRTVATRLCPTAPGRPRVRTASRSLR
jgi:hypothetical protein